MTEPGRGRGGVMEGWLSKLDDSWACIAPTVFLAGANLALFALWLTRRPNQED